MRRAPEQRELWLRRRTAGELSGISNTPFKGSYCKLCSCSLLATSNRQMSRNKRGKRETIRQLQPVGRHNDRRVVLTHITTQKVEGGRWEKENWCWGDRCLFFSSLWLCFIYLSSIWGSNWCRQTQRTERTNMCRVDAHTRAHTYTPALQRAAQGLKAREVWEQHLLHPYHLWATQTAGESRQVSSRTGGGGGNGGRQKHWGWGANKNRMHKEAQRGKKSQGGKGVVGGQRVMEAKWQRVCESDRQAGRKRRLWIREKLHSSCGNTKQMSLISSDRKPQILVHSSVRKQVSGFTCYKREYK